MRLVRSPIRVSLIRILASDPGILRFGSSIATPADPFAGSPAMEADPARHEDALPPPTDAEAARLQGQREARGAG